VISFGVGRMRPRKWVRLEFCINEVPLLCNLSCNALDELHD